MDMPLQKDADLVPKHRPAPVQKAAGAMVFDERAGSGLVPCHQEQRVFAPIGTVHAQHFGECNALQPRLLGQRLQCIGCKAQVVHALGRVVAVEAAVLGIQVHQRDAAAGLECVSKGLHEGARVRHMVHGHAAHDGVVALGQAVEDVLLQRGDVGKALFLQHLQHGAGAVQRGDLCHVRGDGGGQQTGACAKVQHAVGGGEGNLCQQARGHGGQLQRGGALVPFAGAGVEVGGFCHGSSVAGGASIFNALGAVHAMLWDNQRREARQTAAGAIWETRHWRNVRTAQDSVAANGCPP